MASLIEELISTLEEEKEIYVQLIPITQQKTRIIIKDDLEALQNITAKEQEVIDRIAVLEHKRAEVILNIGTVLNRDSSTLTLKNLIRFLDKQPVEQKTLSALYDSLTSIIHRLMEINNQNKSLIEQSLEMMEFNMNFLQSTRMSPGNNYTKEASAANMPIIQAGMFDAKQ